MPSPSIGHDQAQIISEPGVTAEMQAGSICALDASLCGHAHASERGRRLAPALSNLSVSDRHDNRHCIELPTLTVTVCISGCSYRKGPYQNWPWYALNLLNLMADLFYSFRHHHECESSTGQARIKAGLRAYKKARRRGRLATNGPVRAAARGRPVGGAPINRRTRCRARPPARRWPARAAAAARGAAASGRRVRSGSATAARMRP